MASKISDWLTAGYFTINLVVKRGCDKDFVPLGTILLVATSWFFKINNICWVNFVSMPIVDIVVHWVTYASGIATREGCGLSCDLAENNQIWQESVMELIVVNIATCSVILINTR